jgi:hypothetical protein
MRATIYHKTDRGNIFEPYEVGDDIEQVFEFDLDDGELDNLSPRGAIGKAAEACYAAFNGHPINDRWAERADAYYAEQIRSLSVGDVVVIGEVAYAVERFGFAQVTIPGAT